MGIDFKVLLLKISMVVPACSPSYAGGGGRKIANLRSAKAKLNESLISKIKHKQEGWRHSLSDRAFAKQV
jgi:hypothetical protein